MRAFLFLIAVLLWPAAVTAAPVQAPHIEAELVAESRHVRPGEPLTVAVRLRMEEHWHTYWINAGDSGLATQLRWSLPEGFAAGPIQWPAPQRIPVGPLVNYGYEGEVLLLTDIAAPPGLAVGTMATLAADVEWLVCREICIPGKARLTLALPVSTGPPAPDPRWAEPIRATRAALPQPLADWKATARRADGAMTLSVVPAAGAAPLRQLTFFPYAEGVIDNAAPQVFAASGDAYTLKLAPAAQSYGEVRSLAGVLVADPPWPQGAAAVIDAPFASAVAAPAAPSMGLALAMLLAFAGGLILNLMPCVFPVISIKVLGFVNHAHGERRLLRLQGLLFAAGIVVAFWAVAAALMALRAQGEALGWGFQLQEPLFVTALAFLFLALALNLSGVYTIGSRVAGAAAAVESRHPLGNAFLSGTLATLVATPCTAPFMGAALGYAMAQPPATALAVFTALAAGMASPYVVLSFAPALLRRLPRPGAWMETLRQLLAFPLYLTVAWLAWVLGEQAGVDAMARLLAALVVLAGGLWALGHFDGATARGGARAGASATAIAALVAALVVAWPPRDAPPASAVVADGWQPYSAQAFAEHRAAERAVFIDFTAAWCVTCQVNKRLVLETDDVMRAFSRRGVVLMRADWTRQDAVITAALADLGRNGVPVYALYPPGAASAPVLLPELLTRTAVLDALAALPAAASSPLSLR
ncbi:MAG TPA: thioredoxin family protein [Pelomicrobium sp.]|nr:thioredoxin family protein [Pelomicrobium sp.]